MALGIWEQLRLCMQNVRDQIFCISSHISVFFIVLSDFIVFISRCIKKALRDNTGSRSSWALKALPTASLIHTYNLTALLVIPKWFSNSKSNRWSMGRWEFRIFPKSILGGRLGCLPITRLSAPPVCMLNHSCPVWPFKLDSFPFYPHQFKKKYYSTSTGRLVLER